MIDADARARFKWDNYIIVPNLLNSQGTKKSQHTMLHPSPRQVLPGLT